MLWKESFGSLCLYPSVSGKWLRLPISYSYYFSRGH